MVEAITRASDGEPSPRAAVGTDKARGRRTARRQGSVTPPAMDDQYRFTGAGVRGLTFERRWTTPGVHPYDEVTWETRRASITNESGTAVFEQDDVEVPSFWSQLATNVVVSKYFRGHIGTPQREHSVRQLIDRVVQTIVGWASTTALLRQRRGPADLQGGADAPAAPPEDVLQPPGLVQRRAWKPRPQCSACQPYRALVSTPDGMVPIGQLVDEGAIGREVYDASGITRIVAVKHNGRKPVWRVSLRNGNFVEATSDHVVKAVREPTYGSRVAASRRARGRDAYASPPASSPAPRSAVPRRCRLQSASEECGSERLLRLARGSRRVRPADADAELREAEAALAGWLQADGFVGQYDHGTNRSLTIEFQVANDDEYRVGRRTNLDVALARRPSPGARCRHEADPCPADPAVR